MTDQDKNTPELVLVAHSNLERVKEILAEEPHLLNLMYEPWKETPLGAASHVGNRPIAIFLLEQGAPSTITTAAMLGYYDDVKSFLEEDAALANATGAHDISLLFHAAMSGDTRILDLIVSYGGRTDTAAHALHGAVAKGHLEMVNWLLRKNPDPNKANFQGKTPLAVANEMGHAEIAESLVAAGGN